MVSQPPLISAEIRARLETMRIARLATVDPEKGPHLIPICFVWDGSVFYSAIDHKPKRVTPTRLARMKNIKQTPHVALLVDQYDEDWTRLWYVLVRGDADLVSSPAERKRIIKGRPFGVGYERKHHRPTKRNTLMNTEKYIGLDVHQATISVAVLDHNGKSLMECILETKASTILEFFAGLRGTLSVTFEEGTSAAWLYDLLRPHVGQLVVCNPRKNALLKQGNKSDRIDARKLAELLRGNYLKSVYHGETGVRTLRELARSYLTTTKGLTRVMSRLKALYRSWAIPCAGRDVYYARHRKQWLGKIPHAGVRRRAEHLYEHLDMLKQLRQQVRRELLGESRKYQVSGQLRQIPYVGPIRAALLLALIQTPHRFRTKRQLWAYSGLALETRISAEYCYVKGQLRRSKKLLSIRGLN